MSAHNLIMNMHGSQLDGVEGRDTTLQQSVAYLCLSDIHNINIPTMVKASRIYVLGMMTWPL